jgi:hypothetical protein
LKKYQITANELSVTLSSMAKRETYLLAEIESWKQEIKKVKKSGENHKKKWE